MCPKSMYGFSAHWGTATAYNLLIIDNWSGYYFFDLQRHRVPVREPMNHRAGSPFEIMNRLLDITSFTIFVKYAL